MKVFDVITFDCYGTLIDWESGIRAAFETAGVNGGEALRRYAEIEPQVEREYRPYRDVLRESASRIAADFDLASSLPTWKPCPHTNPALERLRHADIPPGTPSHLDHD